MIIPRKYTIHSLIVFLLVLGLSVLNLFKIEFNPHVARSITSDSNSKEILDSLKEISNSQDFAIVFIPSDNGVKDVVFFKEIKKLSEKLTKKPFIDSLFSISNLQNQKVFKSVPFIRESHFVKDFEQFKKFSDIYPKFIGKSEKVTAIYLELNPSRTDSKLKELMLEIKEVFPEACILGGLVTEKAFRRSMHEEMRGLSAFSILIISLIVWYFFRSFKILGASFLIIISTSVITLGMFPILGFSLHPITLMVPTLGSVIAMSDIIHYLSAFQREVGEVEKKLRHSWQKVFRAVVLTSITTAIGFGFLALSGVKPLIELGVSISLAVLIAFVVTTWFLPIVLRGSVTLRASDDSFKFSFKSRWGLLLLLLAGLVAIKGVSQLDQNTYLFQDLKANNELSKALHYMETEFSGIRGVSFQIESKGDVRSYEQLKKIESLLYLGDSIFEWGDVSSIVVDKKRAYRALMGGDPRFFKLSKSNVELNDFQNKTLVFAKMKDVGSSVMNKKVEFFISESNRIGLKTTFFGFDHEYNQASEIITNKLKWGMAGTLAFVLCVLFFVFRDWKWLVFAFVVNVFPLMLTVGVMPLFGISLNMTTGVVFTIALGIAVDDTIHMFYALKATGSVNKALNSAGIAIWRTTIILTLGFGVLLFSKFPSIQEFAILLVVSIFSAGVADLVVLPALLRSFTTSKT